MMKPLLLLLCLALPTFASEPQVTFRLFSVLPQTEEKRNAYLETLDEETQKIYENKKNPQNGSRYSLKKFAEKAQATEDGEFKTGPLWYGWHQVESFWDAELTQVERKGKHLKFKFNRSTRPKLADEKYLGTPLDRDVLAFHRLSFSSEEVANTIWEKVFEQDHIVLLNPYHREHKKVTKMFSGRRGRVEKNFIGQPKRDIHGRVIRSSHIPAEIKHIQLDKEGLYFMDQEGKLTSLAQLEKEIEEERLNKAISRLLAKCAMMGCKTYCKVQDLLD